MAEPKNNQIAILRQIIVDLWIVSLAANCRIHGCVHTEPDGYCLKPEAPGRPFVEQLRPDDQDYFVLKPMHSAFYQTQLDLLMGELGCSSIILSGLATNSCILCTAHDADMRNLKIVVPRDCCAARTAREHKQALEHIGAMADAKVVLSSSLRLEKSHG